MSDSSKLVCKTCGVAQTPCNQSAGHFWVRAGAFNVGDYVVRTYRAHCPDNPPVRVERIDGDMSYHVKIWLTCGGWDEPGSLRAATDAEIKTVTHFTPKNGMLLERIDDKRAFVVKAVMQATAILSPMNEFPTLPIYQFGLDEFAHAAWTILPSYEVKGVTL